VTMNGDVIKSESSGAEVVGQGRPEVVAQSHAELDIPSRRTGDESTTPMSTLD